MQFLVQKQTINRPINILLLMVITSLDKNLSKKLHRPVVRELSGPKDLKETDFLLITPSHICIRIKKVGSRRAQGCPLVIERVAMETT